MTENKEPPKGPDCWKCKYFGITYIPSAPYSCGAMGFRSQYLPSLEVLRTDGQFCHSFIPKSAA